MSADRRFVRLNQAINARRPRPGATVPLFPITTFITPVFEGGIAGRPDPVHAVPATAVVHDLERSTRRWFAPDGGTVLDGRAEDAPARGATSSALPFLSKIPYLNRLFKNVGIGRETRHIMIMVTPRIIINSEEEIFQTEGRPPIAQP